MKILLITENLNTDSGWGKYSYDLANSLKNKGATISTFELESPLRFKRNFILSWWYALKIYRYYRNEKIDVVHCLVEPYAFISYLAAHIMGARLVVTVHGTYAVKFFGYPAYRMFQSMALKNAHKVIAVSEYTKKRVEEYLKLKNLVVIPNGISATPSSSPKDLSVRKVIVGIGGVKKRKGFHLVLKAVGNIRNDIEPFIYYIIGAEQDGAYKKSLEAIVKKEGLQEKVVFTGSVSEAKKEELLKNADLFVLTPISEGEHFEGFGLVYLEANAYGVPVVAMKGSGAEEAVKDGYNGFLAEEGSVVDLGEKIRSIFADSGKYQQLSANALSWARELQWDKVVFKYLKAYEY